MQNERRVVITGIGPIASAGIGKDVFWDGIINRRTGLEYEEIKIDSEIWDKFYFHKVNNFDIEAFNIDKEVIDDINIWKKGKEDRDLFYLLAAVKLAIDDSNISYDKENNDVGLFLTVEHPGFEPFCSDLIRETLRYLQNNPINKEFSQSKLLTHIFKRFSQDGYDMQTFMYLYLIAKAFGIHGYSLFTNNACASGLFALESAARQIRYGDSDIVVLAGGDYSGTMFKHLWFKELGLYSEDGKIKPFSEKASGIVLGDGASAIVLEELGHALNRKAHIYAEYAGGGFSLEGWKVTMPKIGGASYQKTITKALTKAKLQPQDIDLVNPHGVAIKATDSYEAKAISDIFGDEQGKTYVTAFKPYVGHNLGGSGILESIVLLLAVDKDIIPPTLNCEVSEQKYKINLVHELKDCRIKAAMKLSCGFAGYNAAAIFKKYV